jgi:hypothetical protein
MNLSPDLKIAVNSTCVAEYLFFSFWPRALKIFPCRPWSPLMVHRSINFVRLYLFVICALVLCGTKGYIQTGMQMSSSLMKFSFLVSC